MHMLYMCIVLLFSGFLVAVMHVQYMSMLLLHTPYTTPQVDSNSFFLDQSYGANSEVAGIVTLLAVVDQLGRLKRSDTVSTLYTLHVCMPR